MKNKKDSLSDKVTLKSHSLQQASRDRWKCRKMFLHTYSVSSPNYINIYDQKRQKNGQFAKNLLNWNTG